MMLKRPLMRLFPVLLFNLTAFGVAIPVLPALIKAQGGDGIWVGFAFALQAFGQLITGPLWGAASDRYGRKPVLVGTIIAAGLCELATAFSPALWVTLIVRLCAGLCAGNVAAAAALISDVTEAKRRSQGMAIIGISFGLGFTLGPALGALVSYLAGDELSPFGRGMPFVVAAGLDLIAALLGVALVVEARADVASRAASRVKRSWSQARELMRRPGIRAMGELFAVTTVAMTLMETTFFLFMADARGWDEAEVGGLLGAMGLWSATIQGGVGRISSRIGDRGMVRWGCGLLAPGLGFAAWSGSGPLVVLLVLLGLAATGRALLQPGAMALMSRQARDEQEVGEVMGVMQSATSLGRLVGPALGGVLFEWVWTGAPFLTAGALVALAAMRWSRARVVEDAKE
jgi:MFS family permease